MFRSGTYQSGFAPRDFEPAYPGLWRGCVGAWAPCLGPTGVTILDWSGNRRHGTLTNMTMSSAWTPKQGPYSLLFDASNDHITMPVPVTAASDLTWSIWANLNSVASYGEIMSGQSDLHELRFASDLGTFDVAWNFPATGWRTNGGPTVVAGTWYHVALSVTGAGATNLYVNGKSVATSTSDHSTTDTAMYIGRRTSSLYFNGWLDDWRVYNRVLNGNEVRLLSTRRGIAYEPALRRGHSPLQATGGIFPHHTRRWFSGGLISMNGGV